MAETVVIGSGGAGYNTVSRIDDSKKIPIVTINTGDHVATVSMAQNNVKGCRGDHSLGWALAYDYKDDIKAAISGYSNIIVTAGLGGGTGSGTIPIIAECAREQNSKLISVVSIPMAFEKGRRDTAIRQMKEVIRISNRTILFDIDKMPVRGGNSLPISAAISMADEMMKEAIMRINEMLNGPFFSNLTEKVYTIAFKNSDDPVDAVKKAMREYLYDADPNYGKIIATSDSRIKKNDADDIRREISDITGIMPEVVCGEGSGDHRIMLFIPISYRALLS